MGLENLKSAFSNIEFPSSTPEKQGTDVNPSIPTTEKNTTNVQGSINTDLTTMVSQYSIQTHPQQVDFMSNEDAVGFTPNQVEGSPSLFNGNTSIYRIQSEPQIIDYMGNEHSTGFTPNLEHKSPTQFTGAGEHSSEPNMEWANNSLYGATGLVDFQQIASSWTTPLTGLTFPDGFTKNMTESELAKGFLGENGTNFTNTNFYSGIGSDGNGVSFNGPTTSDITSNTFDSSNPYVPIGSAEEWLIPEGFTYQDSIHTTNTISDVFSESWTYSNNIPSPSSGNNTWTIPTNFTYQDSIHTTNAISDTFGGPVDFMSGVNSYYNEVNPITDTNVSSGIPGFTTNFKTGGYTFGEGKKGNSKFLTFDNEGNYTGFIPTGTYSGYHDSGIAWSGSWSYTNDIPSPDTGITSWNTGETSLTSYYDSIHTTNAISDTFGGPVDFMSGKSLHEVSLANSASISGFTKDFTKKGTGLGDSKILDLWDTEWKENGLLTSMWTGYDENYNTMEFPGPYGNFDSNQHPLSASNYTGVSSDPLSREWTPSTSYYDKIHPRNYVSLSDSFNVTTTFAGSSQVTASSGVILNSSKGSNTGGMESTQFKDLYTNDNTATDNKYLGPPQDGSNINQKDRFDLKSELWQYSNSRDQSLAGGTVLALSSFGLGTIMGAFGGNGNEPYIVREIGKEDNPSSYFPLTTLMRDTTRISKFLGSNKGAQFTINQNLMGSFQQYRPYYDAGSTIINTALPSEGLGMLQMNYPRDFGISGRLLDLVNTANTYTEWLDTRVTGFDTTALKDTVLAAKGATFAEREQARKPLAFQGLDLLEGAANDLLDKILPSADPGGSTKAKDIAGIDATSGIDSKHNMQNSMDPKYGNLGVGKGDPFTLFPIKVPMDSEQRIGETVPANSSKLGMPFYFRDLRDGAIIFFRAYLEGITDSISPTWNSENYIGRSEPVYTYKSSEREIGFSLKLFAQTKDELGQIYTKMNRLTSLCYPEYKQSETLKVLDADAKETEVTAGAIGDKLRMKPPLTKFRLGELFGSPTVSETDIPTSAEMVGFIKSLTYNFPDESPWEIQAGYRVPKYVSVDIGFQVIHSESPSLSFALKNTDDEKSQKGFFGINQTLFDNMKNDGTIERKDTI